MKNNDFRVFKLAIICLAITTLKNRTIFIEIYLDNIILLNYFKIKPLCKYRFIICFRSRHARAFSLLWWRLVKNKSGLPLLLTVEADSRSFHVECEKFH